MRYTFLPMNNEYAKEIAYDWRYDDIYSFYNMKSDEEDLEDFINEDNWKDRYFAVLDESKELIGFYSYIFEEKIMWVGFGLKPEVTGNGRGSEFVASGIEFGTEKYKYTEKYIMLAVATFNKRAIKVYENIGFQFQEKYIQNTNGGEYEFVKMKKMIE